MAASIRYQAITAIGTFVALDSSHADYLALDPARCSGLGDAPLRTTVYDAPGQDGSLIFPPKDGQKIVTLAGDLIVTSTGFSAEAGYFAAVDTLYDSLKTALDAGKTAAQNLVTPGGTLKFWKYGPLEEEWQNYWACSVTFSLIVDVFA